MKTHSNYYFFAVAIVALLILASCSNMIYSNKTSITLNLSNLDILRQAQNGGAYKIKCIVMDIDNHKTIADVEKNTDEVDGYKIVIKDIKIGTNVGIDIFVYNASETLAYFGSSEPQIIKVGNNIITVTLTKHSKLELPISAIQYVYKGDGGAELPVDVDFTYEGIDPYSVWELPEPDSGREQKEVWAWEVYNGEQYYYLFEGQTIEPKHGDNGKVILKEKLLTLGDVVLANHQIIPNDEAIDGRTPIGVLASLQKQNSQTKIPLHVLSYKYETGLAWCNDTNLPEYSANVSEPEGIDTKPCPLTGLDSFLDFQTKNKITIDSTNIEKYPIFKAASEMHDGNLEWFIPHGWEVFGCTSDEISADMGSEDPLLNKGLNKIARDNNISGNVLTLDNSTAYWTSTLPNNTDGGNAQASKDFAWNHVAKNSTAPTTIFMAVLD